MASVAAWVPLQAANSWPTASVNEVLASAALLFLVGGLAVLSLIVVLVILQNLFPDRTGGPGDAANAGRELRPIAPSGVQAQLPGNRVQRRRRRQARRPPPKLPIDAALDRLVALNVGEPRLLRSVSDFAHVRLYSCRGCAGGGGGGACEAEERDMAEAFRREFGRAAVREVQCRRRGDLSCEFEVSH